jgi:adenylosuccinate synthase
VGWFDAVALRYTAQLNGMSEVALTKLDILSGISTLRVCVGYQVDGHLLDDFPQDTAVLARCEPVYEDLPGWSEDVSGMRSLAELPANLKAYLARIEALCGVRVTIVSVGPEREQLIVS